MTCTAPRVCILTESFYPAVVGGIEIHAYQVAERLIARGQEVFVVTRHIHCGSPARDRVGNVPVVRIPPRGILKGKGWRALGPILFLMGRLLTWLLRNVDRYDIMMVHGVKVLSIPAVLVCLVGQKKCLIIVNSPMEIWEEISTESLRKMKLSRSSLLLKLWRRARSMILKRADCFIAISAEIHDALIGLGVKPERIRSVPNGIDIDRFYPVSAEEKLRLRGRLNLPANKAVLIFVGRFSAAKGLLLLVQVWRELVRQRRSIHLVLVGSGSPSFDDCEVGLRDYIERHALTSTVSLPGAVDNVFEYLQASDLFIFPSEYEGFGLALCEALACGLPAVSTRVGAAAEMIEDRRTGLLVPPKDPDKMREAIEWLLDHHDQWPAMGARARRVVEERYSLDVVAERYLRLFQDLQRN